MSVDKLFDTVNTTGDGKLNIMQFAELVTLGAKKTSKNEIDLLFRAVDKQHKGFLTKADLKAAFDNIDYVLASNVLISPKDLLIPFLKKMRNRLNLTPEAVFNKFRNVSTQTIGLQEIS